MMSGTMACELYRYIGVLVQGSVGYTDLFNGMH